MRRRWLVCGLFALLATGAWTGAAAAQGDPASFPMKKISVYKAGLDLFRVGESAYCSTMTQEVTAKYPKLNTGRPLYGMTVLGRDPQKPEAVNPMSFVIDEAEGVGKGYDWLILDRNHDNDLANDTPLKKVPAPEGGVPLGYAEFYRFVFFEPIAIPMDCGPELGTKPVKVQPRLMVMQQQYANLGFLPLTVRQGKIEFGGKPYTATLAPRHQLTARYDSPMMGINLKPIDIPEMNEYWWGADQLNAMRPAGKDWFRFETTAQGDKLFVKKYEGETGLLRTGSGGRQVGKVTMNGSLRAEQTAVPVGKFGEGAGDPQPIDEMSLPVGDYLPAYMAVDMDALNISFSNNYHADGRARAPDMSRQFTIPIRKDKPFVLDFSNKPEVIFASPARDESIRPGETLMVSAVLIDPKLDIMIRGLRVTEQKTAQTIQEKMMMGGTQPISLDPKVVITDQNGDKVAEGVMPFG